MEPLTLIAPRGLGDACVAIPCCYHFVRQGREVNLLNAGRTNWVEHLPTLLPLGTKREGEIRDVSHGLSFHSELRMLALVSLKYGVTPFAIPGEPWLERKPEFTDVAKRYGLPRDYIAICPFGSQDYRRMSEEQVAAVAGGWPSVVLHDHPLANMAGLDLTGKTSIPEMVALIGAARAVVAVDSGPLHLSGAMGVPVLAVIGGTLNPYSFCDDYCPSLWITGKDSWTIAPSRVVRGLEALLEGSGL